MTSKIYSMLGLATKAGKLVSGSDVCERALKSGKVTMVILSEDASEATKKSFRDMCEYRKIPYRIFGDRYNLGKHAGKDERAVLGICDTGFTEQVLRMIDSLIIGGENDG